MAVSSTAASTMAMRSRARCGPERSAGGTPLRLAHPRSRLRHVSVVAAVAAAAARALDLERDPAAVRAAHGRLDPRSCPCAGAEKPAMRSKRVRDGDLDADRAALGVVQAERAVVAVDGHDGALVLGRGGGAAGAARARAVTVASSAMSFMDGPPGAGRCATHPCAPAPGKRREAAGLRVGAGSRTTHPGGASARDRGDAPECRGCAPTGAWPACSPSPRSPPTSPPSATRSTGSVVLPGDDGWDAARQAWNLAVDQRPALVALPESAADVQALVDFARTHGLRVAMQGTGHNAAPMGPLDDTMLVKTSRDARRRDRRAQLHRPRRGRRPLDRRHRPRLRGRPRPARRLLARRRRRRLHARRRPELARPPLRPRRQPPALGRGRHRRRPARARLPPRERPSCSGRCAAAAATSAPSSRSSSS